MKFLVDAQLPRRMVRWLASAGCDAIHTLDLPDKNRSSDDLITGVADREMRAVITKDSDFVDSHMLHGRPAKLLLVSTGNLTNEELGELMIPLIPSIVHELATASFLELGRGGIVIRG